LWPQCEGIWRPPLFGSSFAPTAEEHLERRHADREAQGAVAVVGKKPVVAGFERHARRDHDGLVPGAADLKKDQALVLELDFLVVDPPRQQHRPVNPEHLIARKNLRVSQAGQLWPFVGPMPGKRGPGNR
jgi:hypothetical protein